MKPTRPCPCGCGKQLAYRAGRRPIVCLATWKRVPEWIQFDLMRPGASRLLRLAAARHVFKLAHAIRAARAIKAPQQTELALIAPNGDS